MVKRYQCHLLATMFLVLFFGIYSPVSGSDIFSSQIEQKLNVQWFGDYSDMVKKKSHKGIGSL